MTSTRLTRRKLLLAAAGAALLPATLAADKRSFARGRRGAYEALVGALLEAKALPGAPEEARAAADRLAALYADALPRRRAEIDAVVDELLRAKLAHRSNTERLALLRGWAGAGGERRVVAARACALAGAAFGPADRPLPVVI